MSISTAVFILLPVGLATILLILGFLLMSGIDHIPADRKILRRSALTVCVVLALVGGIFSVPWAWDYLHRREIDSLDITYRNFHLALHDDDFESAYGIMSFEYRKKYSLAEFRSEYEPFGAEKYALRPERSVFVWGKRAQLRPIGRGPDAPRFRFRKSGQYTWSLTGKD